MLAKRVLLMQGWIFGALFLSGLLPVFGENVSWTNNAGGLFSNPRNWIAGPNSVNRIPTGSDDVSFLYPNITVTVDGAQATRLLSVSEPISLQIEGTYNVTELFARTGFRLGGSGGNLSVGVAKSLGGCEFSGVNATVGLIDLPSGSVSSPSADPFVIRDGAKVRSERANVVGKVIVESSGEWEHLGDIHDTLTGGSLVPGVLAQISSGGVVRFHQVALSQVEVDAGGRWIGGQSGVVYLRLRNGGAASSDAATMPYGNAYLDGSGSGWAVANSFRMENAFLTVTNGALFSADTAAIANGSEAAVVGAGSRFVSGQDLALRSRMQITDGGSLTAPNLDIGPRSGENGTLFVSGQGSTVVANRRIFLADAGTGSMNLINKARGEANGMLIGLLPKSFGSSLVSGIGTVFVVTGALGIGEGGEAQLNVQDGARFQVNTAVRLGGLLGGNGTLRISGVNTVFDSRSASLQVGDAGAGTLQISEGGRCLVTRLAIAQASGSLGAVELTSFLTPNTTLEAAGDLLVGQSGTGRVTLRAERSGNARLSASGLTVAPGRGKGTVELTGVGASAALAGDVSVGAAGEGILNVQNGARVEIAGNFGLSGSTAGKGTVNIVDPGSSIEVGAASAGLIVGVAGSGEVHLRRSGSLKAPAAVVGAGLGGVVTLEDSGSTFTVSDRLFVGGLEGNPTLGTLAVSSGGHVQVGNLVCIQRDGLMQLGDGTVNIGAPIVPATRTVRVSNGGTLKGDGLISATAIVVAAGGRLAPGCSIGRMRDQGDLEIQSGGTVEVELAGLVAGTSYDTVIVTGSARFAGTLIVRFVDGFAPKRGHSFDLVQFAGAASGTFDKIEVQGAAPGFQPQVTIVQGALRLTALNDAVATSAPRLSVEQDGNELTLSWPENVIGYTLQSTSAINSPWQNSPVQGNVFKTSTAGPTRFFRLERSSP